MDSDEFKVRGREMVDYIVNYLEANTIIEEMECFSKQECC